MAFSQSLLAFLHEISEKAKIASIQLLREVTDYENCDSEENTVAKTLKAKIARLNKREDFRYGFELDEFEIPK
jgi:hypothetical protein